MINSSGVGVYLRGCLPWFLASPRRVLLLGDTETLVPLTRGKANARIIECRVKPFSARELLAFPRTVLKEINRCDLFYSPFFNVPGGIRVPVYTTIHDIIFPDMPQLTSKAGLAARMWFYRRAFRRSQKLFTVSSFSRARLDFHSRGRVPIVVTHSAVRSDLLSYDEAACPKEDFILFIGNLKQHKGLQCLIDAFEDARKGGLTSRLVIAGSGDNLRTRAAPPGTPGVEWAGSVSDGELAALLARARLLVQPSLYEGFGLPPLEAMAIGTRALVSDIPVFREIYDGFPVAYFRAGDTTDLKEKLLAILADGKTERISLSDGLKNRYTFEKTASVILKELS
jgi:glycosyltransferase involved in cell wall biosynthesis